MANRPHNFSAIVALSLLTVWMAAIAPAVEAHVLQGPHILELMAAALAGGRSLRVQQTVWLGEGEGDAAAVEYSETLEYLFPGRFRAETQSELTQRVFVADQRRSVTVVDGVLAAEQAGRYDAYKDLLDHRSRNELVRILLAWGVDVSTSSLGLWQDSVVYVIGAQYPDESLPQVWVDKESLLPVRWICYQAAPAQTAPAQPVEFVYRTWRKNGDLWYPMEVETYLAGRITRRCRVQEITENLFLAEERFDITKVSEQALPEPPSAERRDADELQRMLEDFNKKFQP